MATLPCSSIFFSSRALPNVSLNIPKPRRTISCKANGANDKVDRRDVLIGLGGLYSLGTSLPALSLPILPPDLNQCHDPALPDGARPIKCCIPPSDKIIDYELPSPCYPLRIRRPAHACDPEYIAKYEEAVFRMKQLNPNDPRSFGQQARVHCAYCNGAYYQAGTDPEKKLDLQVHNSWLFFPFHRIYLHFHERILGSLIDDDSFALPFWNWDTPAGMTLPSMYTVEDSPLYDKFRDVNHTPSTIMNLDFDNGSSNNAQQIDNNLSIMHRQVIGATTANLFMGAPFRRGDSAHNDPQNGAGTVENVPHNVIHYWTGDKRQPNQEDLGNFYSSGFDPIFYAHHCNVDRLWNVWQSLGHSNFTDPDWLDAQFLLYDENAELVRVKVRDCLDNEKMGYTYPDVNNPWISAKPRPAVLPRNKTRSARKLADTRPEINFPLLLEKKVSLAVKREKLSRRQKEKKEEEEVLVVGGLEIPEDQFTKFDVYINAPEGQKEVTPANTEFAGSFVRLAHSPTHVGSNTTNFRVGITQALEDLRAENDENIVVTLVPRMGKVKVGSVYVEFEAKLPKASSS